MQQHVTVETTLDEILALPEMAPYRRFMVYAPAHVPEDELPTHGIRQLPLRAVGGLGWSAKGIAEGMDSFLEAIGEGRVSQHFVYEDSDDPAECDVNLIRILPTCPDPTKPFVILCSGGSYKNVCTLGEGITVGRHLSEAGYQVFLLTYRVSVPEALPHALDDVAASLGWITGHADELELDPGRYAIAGFSAGGNLACTWGLPDVGWRTHGMSRPLCVLAIYANTDLDLESRRTVSYGALPRMLGENWRGRMAAYDVVSNVDADYPPCYIVCGRNDGLLPCRHSELLKERLDAAGVLAVLEEHKNAPHGFGDGTGTDAEGWPERAMAFLDVVAR